MRTRRWTACDSDARVLFYAVPPLDLATIVLAIRARQRGAGAGASRSPSSSILIAIALAVMGHLAAAVPRRRGMIG